MLMTVQIRRRKYGPHNPYASKVLLSGIKRPSATLTEPKHLRTFRDISQKLLGELKGANSKETKKQVASLANQTVQYSSAFGLSAD